MLPRMGWVDVFGEDALGGAGETGVVPPPAGPAEGLVDGDDVDAATKAALCAAAMRVC